MKEKEQGQSYIIEKVLVFPGLTFGICMILVAGVALISFAWDVFSNPKPFLAIVVGGVILAYIISILIKTVSYFLKRRDK